MSLSIFLNRTQQQARAAPFRLCMTGLRSRIGLHPIYLKGVIQMFANSSITSPALVLFVSRLLKSTAVLSLKAEEMNTKYLFVNGVRINLGTEPRYSFCWLSDHPPHKTLQEGSRPVQKSLIYDCHSKSSTSVMFLSIKLSTMSLWYIKKVAMLFIISLWMP